MKDILNRYQHVIWDWNGTLIDDISLIVDITNQMMARRGLNPIDIDIYRAHFGFPVADFYVKMGFDFAADPYEALVIEFTEAYESRCLDCTLHDGALDLLEYNQRRNIPQSILSASNLPVLIDTVKAFGIYDYFTEIAALDNKHARGKLETGQALISKMGVNPASTVLIGDTLHDYEVARGLGLDCVIVPNGSNSAARFAGTSALIRSSLKD